MGRQALTWRWLAAAIMGIAICSGVRAEPPAKPAAAPAESVRILSARDPERPCAVLDAGLPLPSIAGQTWNRFFDLFHFEMNLLLPPREF